MARQTIVRLIDDLDGSPIDDGKGETVTFALDSTAYEIDLSSDNAKALRDALKPYTKAGRSLTSRTVTTRRGGGAATRSNAATRSKKEELAAAREWLRANGHAVGDRGRIAGELMELYRASK